MKTITLQLTDEDVAQVMLALGFMCGGVASRENDVRLAKITESNLALANKISKQHSEHYEKLMTPSVSPR